MDKKSIWRAVLYTFAAGKNGSAFVLQTAMYVGGIGLFAILLLRLPYLYVKEKLPGDLQERPWVEMNEEEFRNSKIFGVAGLLLGTSELVVVSLVVGFVLPVATIFIFS